MEAWSIVFSSIGVFFKIIKDKYAALLYYFISHICAVDEQARNLDKLARSRWFACLCRVIFGFSIAKKHKARIGVAVKCSIF